MKCRYLIHHLLLVVMTFVTSIQAIPRPQSSMTTAAIQTFKCSAIMEPKDLIIQPDIDHHYDELNQIDYLLIRCSAILNTEMFTNPVFDLSFGDTSNTGLYIVRGIGKCQKNHTKCESEFRVPGQALKQLLLLPSLKKSDIDATTTQVNHQHHHQPSSIVKVTCDVADTSKKTKSPVRCTDSTTIKFPRVLQYGEPCSLSNESTTKEMCGSNMRCIQGNGKSGAKCHCKTGAINTYAGHDRVICVEPVTIGQRCVLSKQCSERDPNSSCLYDNNLGYKICQCQDGFGTSYSSSQGPTTSPSCHRFDLNNTGALESNEKEEKNSNSFSNLGLVIFFILIFWIIIIGAILFRIAKHRSQYKMDTDGETEKKSVPIKSASGSVTNHHHQIEDEDEVEIKIFDDEKLNGNLTGMDFSGAKQSVV